MKTDDKILTYNNVAAKIANHKRKGQKIAFVSGCFDVLHIGHIIFLDFAKKQADILVVGVGSDATLRKLKGKGRPVIPEKSRARTLASLEVVDYVVINKEKLLNYNIDHSILISKVKPDLYIVPATDKKLLFKKEMVERNGGKLKTCRRVPPRDIKGGVSSTGIIEKLNKL